MQVVTTSARAIPFPILLPSPHFFPGPAPLGDRPTSLPVRWVALLFVSSSGSACWFWDTP